VTTKSYTLDDVLNGGGAELIEESIKQAEQATGGEIVVRLTQTVTPEDAAPRAAAIEEFGRLNIANTKLRNGVLLYIALDQHAVELVADEGITALVPHETWQQIVDIVALGFKTGVPAQALAMAITRIGELLATHFPCPPTDTNELSNRIVLE
jgi:uncharacterized membrane protein